MHIKWRIIVALSLGLSITSAGATQPSGPKKNVSENKKDAPKSAGAKQARAQFDQVSGEWKELLAALADLQGKYENAADSDKGAIEKEYNDLAAKGEKLAARLKSATEAAFAADPADKEVQQLLAVMAYTALREDRYEEAARLAQLGLEQNPADQQLAIIAANAAFNLDKFDQVEPLLTKSSGGRALPQKLQELLLDARKYQELWKREEKVRQDEAKADDLPRVKLATSKGDIVIELFENEAPNTVANFISLVEKGFYDGIVFHRVLPGFMAQGGDPTGTGTGGPGYAVKDEFANPGARAHFRGTLSMANTGRPNTNGSQFFLTFKPTPHLNGRHTVFGRVIKGLDLLPELQRIDPEKPSGAKPDKIEKATVIRKRDHAYKPETIKE